MPRILLAFDKFKDALTAEEACDVAASTLSERHPGVELDICPLTDGGEGFARIMTGVAGGAWRSVTVTGPLGVPVIAGFGIIATRDLPASVAASLDIKSHRKIAVVEMALASGLEQVPASLRDPWNAQSTGTGELLRAAAHEGVDAIVLGVGGSATNDLGLCALAALGLVAVDANGVAVAPPVPQRWADVAGFQSDTLTVMPPLFIACDVTNPLLGERGCSAVYGPQKGLQDRDFEVLEQEVARVSSLLCEHFGRPLETRDAAGAGAAGGIAFGLQCAVGARIISGSELFSAWVNLPQRISLADCVITGEGRFDAGSWMGKGAGALALQASQAGKTVHIFAGSIDESLAVPAGINLHAITPQDLPLEGALRQAGSLLADALRQGNAIGGQECPPSGGGVKAERSADIPVRLEEKGHSSPLNGGQECPPSFYDPHGDIEKTSHHLSHWQQGTAWVFVTWRLGDSLPKEMLDRWKVERDAWLLQHPEPWNEKTESEYHDRFSRQIDEWLDQGIGSCVLKEVSIGKIVADALRHFDRIRYELEGFVVMPNHVHVLFRTTGDHALPQILKLWKGFTSREINKLLGKGGRLWQDEYWDRLIRHEQHFFKVMDYIRENPKKAKLEEGCFILWERRADIPVR